MNRFKEATEVWKEDTRAVSQSVIVHTDFVSFPIQTQMSIDLNPLIYILQSPARRQLCSSASFRLQNLVRLLQTWIVAPKLSIVLLASLYVKRVRPYNTQKAVTNETRGSFIQGCPSFALSCSSTLCMQYQKPSFSLIQASTFASMSLFSLYDFVRFDFITQKQSLYL